MDNELKAIQEELDSVLEKLDSYLNSNKLNTEYVEPEPCPREDVARVVYHYSQTRDLENSIHFYRWSKANVDSFERSQIKEHGEQRGQVEAALEALDTWIFHGEFPLQRKHIQTLCLSANALSRNVSEYFGQESGVPLKPKKLVDKKKFQRQDAAEEVWRLNRADPQENPIGEMLFEKVGKKYGMSFSVVRRAYYSNEARDLREVLEGDFLDPSEFPKNLEN